MANELDFESAQMRMLEVATVRLQPAETIALQQALGRVNAQAVHARLDVPPADSSAMDGYAIRHAQVGPGQPLMVQGPVYAGDTPPPLHKGHACRLFTGSWMPAGADTVVMQEHCRENNAQVLIDRLPQPGANVRLRGEDMASGQQILPAGERLNSRHVAMLAAQGYDRIAVRRDLAAGVISIGDELCEPGVPLQTGQIYNSNAPMLEGQLRELGVNTIHQRHVPDFPDAICQALLELANSCDLLLSIGAASVGDKDFVRPAIIEAGGQIDFSGVRMKPGRPFMLARVADRPLVALPGNPVAANVTFLLLVSPMIRCLQGRRDLLPPVVSGQLMHERHNRGPSDAFLRVRAHADHGRLQLEPAPEQGSAMLASLAWASGLVRLPPNQTISAGEPLDYYDFARWSV